MKEFNLENITSDLNNLLLKTYYSLDVTSFISKYHCPLRFQGNFIKKSIDSFKSIANEVNSSQLVNTDNPITNTIKDLLKIDNDTINNKKLVIFTCIRLDDYTKGEKGEKVDKIRYENNKEAINESLQFSHCINPVRKIEDTFNCETKGGRNSILSFPNKDRNVQMGGNVYDINYDTFQDSHVSFDTISFLQQMVFMYTIKILRWSFYYKQRKTEEFFVIKNESSTYSNVLIDYIVTMMVSLGVYATNNSTLFYGMLFDEIMSILMFLKTKDEEILLVPYFLVMYGIDYLK
ncbi:hypothetical protein QKU58_gp029 [Pyramimonas orientalis virus]|uniref:Uncharacterized protein n=1 Tax=Pyramimonas orientalis virus 01B TaxID=3134525 RepID=A0A7M3UNN1_9VIRU|nr:hypothetical protein QKU58_gp029 [Pyramimonas orientalis virus]QOI90302.1 hypothetical protein HWQ62_00165 [Pyramimonas orientalis virus]